MIYIISLDGKDLIATTRTELKSGSTVKYSHSRAEESINANRKYNLVSPRKGKISRSKKWEKAQPLSYGIEINEGEFFLIHDDSHN